MVNQKISARQFGILVTLWHIGTTVLFTGGVITDAKQDGWLASLLGLALGLLAVWLYTSLGTYFPNTTIIKYNEKLLGAWLGKIVSLLFVFFGFIGATTLLFYIGNFMTTVFMPETPIQAIIILFTTIVLMGLRLGLETLARTAEIFFPWFVFLFFFTFIFLTPEMEFKNLQPILENGIKPIINGSLDIVGSASLTMIAFFVIYPAYVSNPKQAKKVFFITTLIGGIFIVLFTLLSITVLGVDASTRLAFPNYALAKQINIGGFINRVEALIVAMWFISIYFKLTLYAYICVFGFSQVLNLKDYRPLTMPFGMIFVVYSLVVYPNAAYMGTWDSTIWIPYILTLGVVLPLLLLLIGIFRKNYGSWKE